MQMQMQGSEGSESFTYDSFIRVNRRKRKGAKTKSNPATPSDLLVRVKGELVSDITWSLDCKEIFQAVLLQVRIKPRKVLCLGLGSPSSSRDARAQLAFLSQLCTFSDIDSANVFVYDPVFTDADRELFQALGMQCLDHHQAGRHSVDGPTMLYMPHCDLNLYEAVIRANWTFERLCNIIFLANRFSDYIDNNPVSKIEKESPCLMQLGMTYHEYNGRRVFTHPTTICGTPVPFVESRPLPMSEAFPTAFNNLSVQYVSRTPLSLTGNTFWETLPLLRL